MTITRSLAQLQKEHVALELECIDRMYLNAYAPQLTSEGGAKPGAGTPGVWVTRTHFNRGPRRAAQ